MALKRMRMEREKDAIPVSELQEMTILLGPETENWKLEMKKIAVTDLVLGAARSDGCYQ